MAGQEGPVTVGQALPPLTLPDLEGRPLALASLRGKRVLLFMWGSW